MKITLPANMILSAPVPVQWQLKSFKTDIFMKSYVYDNKTIK